jgi:hypothetical protein
VAAHQAVYADTIQALFQAVALVLVQAYVVLVQLGTIVAVAVFVCKDVQTTKVST